MRIAIAIAITLTLAAALAPMQQAHGWAASCADGNTDVCCHLERIGWEIRQLLDVTITKVQTECDPYTQRVVDRIVPRMCETDCWGGAAALSDSYWATMPTQAGVLNTQCTVTHFVNGTCPPPAAPTPTPISSTASSTASPTESSSTASPTESSSSSTGTDANAHSASSAPLGPADEDSIGAAAPQMHSLWAFALAFALVLWH
jgi:hypothetical protein